MATLSTKNSLRVDPTRTGTLRRALCAQLRSRFAKLKLRVRALVLDAFPVTNAAFDGKDSDKVDAFKRWFKDQCDSDLTGADAHALLQKYAGFAVQQGSSRAYGDVKKVARGQDALELYSYSKAEFMRQAFSSPEYVDKVRLLGDRSFTDLHNISTDMQTRTSRVLVDGLGNRSTPATIARAMLREMDISGVRADTMARTEIVRAFAEGQLATFTGLGAQAITVAVELADDGHECEECAAAAGAVYTPDEARGLIPFHPNCRCAWSPSEFAANVNPFHDEKGRFASALAVGTSSQKLAKDLGLKHADVKRELDAMVSRGEARQVGPLYHAPKGAASPAATPGPAERGTEDLLSAVERIGKGNYGLAHIADVHDAVGGSLADLHARIQEHRREGKLTGTAGEARHGFTERERAAAIPSGDHPIHYVSVRNFNPFHGAKGLFASAMGAEHAVKQWAGDKVEENVSRLPPKAQTAVRGLFKALTLAGSVAFASYTAGQAFAERVAKERGYTDEQAHRLRGVLAGLDVATAKPVALTLGAAASFVPVASVAYLAYSTARDPVATIKAAARLVPSARRKSDYASFPGMNTAAMEPILSRLERCNYDDFEIAKLSVELDSAVRNSFCPTGEGGGVDPTCSTHPSDKAMRAKAAHVLIGAEIQRYAEEHGEVQTAKALGGASWPDSEPIDIAIPHNSEHTSLWQKAQADYSSAMAAYTAGGKKGTKPAPFKVEGDIKHGVELKTPTVGKNGTITMDKYAQVRKHLWEKEGTGRVFHTVVKDDREVFNADGPGKHDESKRVWYYRRGVAGSTTIESLHRCKDEAEVRRLMDLPEKQLPDKAKRTDGKLSVGKWKPVKGERAYRNTKTGEIARAKK